MENCLIFTCFLSNDWGSPYILDGIVTGYYEDGTIQVRATYDNGVKQGRVIRYYPNGTKQVESFYTDDKFDGVRTTWYENGKPI